MKSPISIIQLKVTDLVPNDYNPNVVPENTMRQLVKDVKRKGIKQPVLVRQKDAQGKYTIIDGEHRWRAATELGEEFISCEILDITREEAMLTTISMNKLRGEFDPIKLGAMFKELSPVYGLADLEDQLGFSVAELQSYMEMLDFDPADMEDPDVDVNDLVKEDKVALSNEFSIPVTFAQLDIIESFITADAGDTESKSDVLVRVLGDLLQKKYPTVWQSVQGRAGALEEAETEDPTSMDY